MKLIKRLGALLVLGLAATSGLSEAAVVWDQPLPNGWAGGYCSPCQGDLPAPNYDYRVFGSFSLSASTTLTKARFALYDEDTPGDLHISIWNSPNVTELFSVIAPKGSYTEDILVPPERYYAVVDLPSWFLPAGDYWLSIFGINGNHLAWGGDNTPGDDVQYSAQSSTLAGPIYVGFSLSDNRVAAAPEPGVLALLGVALAAFCRSRRGNVEAKS